MAALFNVSDFLHPLDLSARQQLESIPMLHTAVKKYLGAVTDRRYRQELLSSALRLNPRQLPDYYRLLPPICEAFGIEVPELYLSRGSANAAAVGYSRTAIIIYNELLEDLAEDEVEAVLAHECGHVMAEHILYRQMAQSIIAAGSGAGALGGPLTRAATQIATAQIEPVLLNWYRKSELTADRAAVAWMGDPAPMQRALFHIIGVPKWVPGELSYTALLEQADEVDAITKANKWDSFLARNIESSSTHPIPTVRIRELTKWASSPTFDQVMRLARAGGYGTGRRCSACGQRLVEDWTFCQGCGLPVDGRRRTTIDISSPIESGEPR